MQTKKFKTVDEYISFQPVAIKKVLKEFRNIIKETAPQAEEVISYNMPAFKQNGMLVYYAGWKEHIGFYPVSSAIRVYEKELASYKTSKGSIQFPLGRTIPVSLVKKIVKFRVKENLEKAKAKELLKAKAAKKK